MEAQGYYVVKLILTNKPGIPDLLCLKNGKAFFVEVKRPGEKSRPLQYHRINELKEMGFRCEVWDNSNIEEKMIADTMKNNH